jgi:small-conductance mechanosensitive channel/CRP-like cAMP-binding protein
MRSPVFDYSVWIAVSLFAIAAILWKPLESDRPRVRAAFSLLILWVFAALFAAAASRWNAQARVANEIARTLLLLSAIQIGFLLLFDIVLRRVRLPKFLSEISIVAAYIAALFQLLNRLGVDATGLFATSAVATAVVGLALQDMLSNLAGGMTLQLENSINPGDYIRCGDHAGWVEHVRLRHTSIVTSDNDTVVLPNSFLTRSAFVIIAKSHRRLVPFAMPYASNPHEIIDAIEHALRSSPLTGMAAEPRPRCYVQEMATGHIQYAACVWLTDPGRENEAISALLNRIYYALERAGLPISEITYLMETKAPAPPVHESSPEDILRRMPIFRLLEQQDLSQLATVMRRLNFAPGEHILRQGDPGDSMYFVVVGRVGVSYRATDGAEQDLASFESGDFFGEASLLTGETRTATATALTRVTCYCLDKAGLQNTMQQQPELAEDISVIMAHRQIELVAAREKLDRETALRREAESQTQILARIRRFFGIAGSAAGAD